MISTTAEVTAEMIYPVPLAKQIKESEVILEGTFVSENSIKFKDKIITVSKFRVLKSIGLQDSTLQKDYLFKVASHGGVLNDRVVSNKLSPVYKQHERVVLFLKKEDGRYWPVNNALSKYTFVKRGRSEYLISNVFPFHPSIGQIPYKKFIDKSESIKKVSYMVNKLEKLDHFNKSVSNKKFTDYPKPVPVNNKLGRSIASISKKEKTESEFSELWLIMVMLSLVAISFYFKRHQH